MNEKLKQYAGGVSWIMAGRGPKPVLAPPDETGNAGAGADDDAGNDDAGDDKGSAGDDASGGDKPSGKTKLGGLFAGKADDKGDGTGADDDKPGEDGRPAGLADKFWNPKDKTVNVDALTKSYKEIEKAYGELKRSKVPAGGEVPKDAAEYFADGVKVPEAAANFKDLGNDDPGVKSWAEVCQKRGIGKDLATGLMSDMLVAMNGHAPVPIDPAEEMKALGPNGAALVDGVYVWIDGKAQAGEFSEDDVSVIETMSQTANGIRLLAKFRNLSGVEPIPVTPGAGTRGMSQDQWHNEMKAAVKAKDYKRQAELEEMGNSINGTEPGISGRQGGVNI